jgi:hypothetical protein
VAASGSSKACSAVCCTISCSKAASDDDAAGDDDDLGVQAVDDHGERGAEPDRPVDDGPARASPAAEAAKDRHRPDGEGTADRARVTLDAAAILHRDPYPAAYA